LKLNRRTLLVGGGAGVGLVVAWTVWPRAYAPGLLTRDGEQVFGHFLKIGPDGRVTIAVPQVETGQGAWTALPQLLADELGAAWDSVGVEPAPPGPVYANAFGGDYARGRVTAGATSVRAFSSPLRGAGATARFLLCAAAAREWGVAVAECDTAEGFVEHEGKRLPFGAVVEAAAALTPREHAPLRPAGSGRLAGRALPRLDGPPKADGSLRFAGDVRLPGLLFAAVRFFEVLGHRGGKDVHAGEGWIAAIGATGWAAEQALRIAEPHFAGPPGGDDEKIERALSQSLDSGEPTSVLRVGDGAFDGRIAGAEYSQGPLLHLGLEPLTATARMRGGKLELWVPTQAPDATRAAAARAAGVTTGDVILFPMPVGGPDGRALHADAAPVAAVLARKLDRPVQVTAAPAWSRRAARPLAPARARLRAELGSDNRLLGWHQRVAGKAVAAFPYEVPTVLIEQTGPDLPLRAGYMRGDSELFSAFVQESFVDELARRHGFEPLAYRVAMLGGEPRLARVLSTVAAIGGWDGGGAGSSMGLACHMAFGSYIALLASATVGPDGRVQVDRLVAAVDCGRMVNPGLVRQQVEGNLLGALALVTGPRTSFRHGMPVGGGSSAPRMRGTPAITVETIPSTAPSGGLSGLPMAVLAPAVANAIAAATGRRLRSLPLDPISAP
jgi:isoquinoline 1-oxidoreductase beta subunit